MMEGAFPRCNKVGTSSSEDSVRKNTLSPRPFPGTISAFQLVYYYPIDKQTKIYNVLLDIKAPLSTKSSTRVFREALRTQQLFPRELTGTPQLLLRALHLII